MTYTAKVAVCSEIRTKHSTQNGNRVEFWILNLGVVRKKTLGFKWLITIYFRLFKSETAQLVFCRDYWMDKQDSIFDMGRQV